MKRRSPYPILVSALLLALAAFLSLPKLYDLFKKEVAKKHAENFEILPNVSDQTVLEKLQAGHALDPDNLEITRKLAKLLNQVNPEQAMQQFEEIVQNPKSTLEDKLAYIRLAIETGDFSKAQIQLSEIEINSLVDDQKLEFHILNAQVEEANGRIDSAIRQIRMILAEGESDFHNAARYSFIRNAILSENPLLVNEAKELLHTMTQEEGAQGIEAIRFYFGIRGFTKDEARSIFVKTLKHPLATSKDKLEAATLYQNSLPFQTSQIIESIKSLAEFSASDPPGLYSFCLWLARIHQWEALIEHLSPANSLLSAQLYTLRLDALYNLGKWDDIIDTVSKSPAPIPDHFRLVFLSRAYNQNGMKDEALQQMDLILDRIREDRDALFKTCEYLEKTKETDSLLYLLDKAVLTIPALEAYACSKRIRHKLSSASLEDICQWYGVLYSQSTNILEFRARKTYFDLLADKNLGEAILNAKSLFNSDPTKLENRILLALAQVKSGKLKDAQDVLDDTPLNIWTQSTVGWKMLYAHIMKKNGLNNRAEEFLKTVPTAKLSNAEREGFENL